MPIFRFISIEELRDIDEEVFSLLDGLKHRRFCKAEIVDDSVVCGQIVIPKKEDEDEENDIFGFCTSNDGLYLINTPSLLKDKIQRMRMLDNNDKFGVLTLSTIISQLIKDDFYYLQNQEEDLKRLEDIIFNDSDKNDDVKIFEARKNISRFTRYYDQLLESLEDIQDFCRDIKMEEEEETLGRLYRKVERLEALSTLVGDYAKQLLDLHSSRVASQQNDIMTLLTIVTSIIAPLTLITGWYGMNFIHMPELRSPFGYISVIGVCVLIVALELWYMKRKNWFK